MGNQVRWHDAAPKRLKCLNMSCRDLLAVAMEFQAHLPVSQHKHLNRIKTFPIQSSLQAELHNGVVLEVFW